MNRFRSSGGALASGWAWARVAAVAAVVAAGWMPGVQVPVASATQLIAPAIGIPDAALNGATVATPQTPTAAAFSNPAGITNLAAGAVSTGIGIPVGHSRVHATTPPGYDTTSDFVAYAPEGGSVFEHESGLRWGFALYGALGSSFDSDAEPSVGVTSDFYSATAVSNAALMVAYPVTDRLSVGVALALMYGQAHLRYTQQTQFAYTVRGPGTQAMFGLRYRLTDRVALGLGFRTPGMVWADGDERLPSGDKQDVELNLDMPAQIFVGVNADVTDRLHLGLSGRWTDASTFSDSNFRFDQTPEADIPFIQSASDEWRLAAGASYAVLEPLKVSFGVSYADKIVPDSWVSPLLIDSNEWKFSTGLAWQLPGEWSDWILDIAIGYSPNGVRNISDSEAAILPGRYNIGGEIYMIGFRTTL
ncbi:MAG: OmpP1/FadL family transporter [Candidatus Binatia bacterium]